MPVRETVCGDPVALSATLSVPEKLPKVAGVKFTEIAQLLPADSVVPQVVLSLNEEEVEPPPILTAMPVRGALPVFESVTVCAPAEAGTFAVNVREDALRPAIGEATAVPVPLSVTVWGELAALSVTVIVELSGAADFGVKAMVKVQLAPAVSDVPQVVVSLKSVVSETVKLFSTSVAVPESVRVSVCVALVCPTVVLGKLKLVAESVRAETLGVPVPPVELLPQPKAEISRNATHAGTDVCLDIGFNR